MLSIIHQSQASSRPLFINSELDFFSTLCKRLVKSYSKYSYLIMIFIFIIYWCSFPLIAYVCLFFGIRQNVAKFCRKKMMDEQKRNCRSVFVIQTIFYDEMPSVLLRTCFPIVSLQWPQGWFLRLEKMSSTVKRYFSVISQKKKAQMATLLLNM